jgi:hypothetical protein
MSSGFRKFIIFSFEHNLLGIIEFTQRSIPSLSVEGMAVTDTDGFFFICPKNVMFQSRLKSPTRAARDAASAETSVTEHLHVEPQCNKRKSYRLPPLPTPTEIPGYPLNPSPAQEVPDYETMGRVKAIKARQRGGGTPRLDPSGPPELLKRGDVRTWKVADALCTSWAAGCPKCP